MGSTWGGAAPRAVARFSVRAFLVVVRNGPGTSRKLTHNTTTNSHLYCNPHDWTEDRKGERTWPEPWTPCHWYTYVYTVYLRY